MKGLFMDIMDVEHELNTYDKTRARIQHQPAQKASVDSEKSYGISNEFLDGTDKNFRKLDGGTQ